MAHQVISLHKALHPCITLLLLLVTRDTQVSPHEALGSHGPCQGANKPFQPDVVDALINLDRG